MNDFSPAQPENIVAINDDVKKELEIKYRPKSAKLPCFGLHKKIVVDSEQRIIECELCGFVVDPFDYIEQWAIEGDRRMTGLKDMDARIRIATAEHADLIRKINNLRGRLKRAGQPQPDEERAEFNRQRWNAGKTPMVV